MTPLLITLPLIGLLFLRRPNWQALPERRPAPATKPAITKHPVPANRTIIGGIDSQDLVGKVHGESDSLMEPFGWIASTNPSDPVKQVDILINGHTMATVHRFVPRPDRAAYFDRPDFYLSGWIAAVPLDGIKPGKYEFVVRAVTAAGKEDALPSVQLIVSE